MENGKLVTIRDDGLVRTDYLFRISIKALIYNESGDLLVVKEHGLNWGLPGGGMDFGETFDPADLARHDGSQVRYAQYFHSRLQDRLSSC